MVDRLMPGHSTELTEQRKDLTSINRYIHHGIMMMTNNDADGGKTVVCLRH